MARPKYTITASDANHVKKYLSAQLLTDDWYCQDKSVDVDKYIKAKKAFAPAASTMQYADLPRKDRPAALATSLQQWATKWLTQTHWDKLKTAVKKRRSRANQTPGLHEKSVTMNAVAKKYLTQLAENQGLSISDFLIKILEPDYNKWSIKMGYGGTQTTRKSRK